MTDETNSAKATSRRRLRYTAVGSVLLSPDFYVSLPAAMLFGLLPALLPAVRSNGFTFFLTVGGVAAGLAAVALASMSILLAGVGAPFMELLRQTPGGIAELLRPFRITAAIAGVASVVCFTVGAIAPLSAVTTPWGIWVWVTGAMTLFFWALFATAQTLWLTTSILTHSQEVDELQQRRRKALASIEERSRRAH